MSTATTTDKRKKRGTAIKFALAAIALTGIGAAATSAAWSDDAWFSASATAATVELQGSLSGTTGFVNADDAATAIAIPTNTFQNLTPNQVRTVKVYVKNTSSVPLTVAPTLTPGGALFAAPKPATATIALTGPAGTLAVDGIAEYTVTVTGADWTNSTADLAYQGVSGSLTVKFTGTTAP